VKIKSLTMDFKGQKLAEILYTIIIALFGLVGFVWGYQEQDFTYCFRCWFVGVALASILTIPDWGMFNKNSPKWLDDVPAVWSTRETTEENEEKVVEQHEKKRSKKNNVSKRSAAKARDKN
jgi:signal peptidase complex subunit 1